MKSTKVLVSGEGIQTMEVTGCVGCPYMEEVSMGHFCGHPKNKTPDEAYSYSKSHGIYAGCFPGDCPLRNESGIV